MPEDPVKFKELLSKALQHKDLLRNASSRGRASGWRKARDDNSSQNLQVEGTADMNGKLR